MKIIIETIPHDQQRYDTCGDYFFDDAGDLQIRVSAMANSNYEILVAIHELVEVVLTQSRGIPEADIMAFDLAHPDSDDPGHDPAAPYNNEHVFAECIERLVATELHVNWRDYELAVGAL